MLTESRTKNNIFEAWKLTQPKIIWREYWDNLLIETIDLYKKLNWNLIDIVFNDKVPLATKSWVKEGISYDTALIRLRNNFNIGVNLHKSNLIVADIDSNVIPILLLPYINKTMSVISKSSNYHIYFNFDKNYTKEELNKIADKIGIPDLWRGKPNKPQYTLIPLSRVDKKFYEWINISQLMNISKLMEEI